MDKMGKVKGRVAGTKVSILLRILWVATYCICLASETTPVLTTFAKIPTPIWKIPFPAITICPETQIKQRQFNFTDAYKKWDENKSMTEDELRKFEISTLACDSHWYKRESNKTYNKEDIEFLKKVAPSAEDTLFYCSSLQHEGPCTTLFTPIITEIGMCFTYNMLDLDVISKSDAPAKENKDWSLQTGYSKDATREAYPRRALTSGTAGGQVVVLRVHTADLDYICRGPYEGFRVLLHSPDEMPRVNAYYFRAPLNQAVLVSIKPELRTISKSLHKYDPEERQCFLPNEHPLKFFRIYTQRNCEVECIANYTLRACNCMPYYLPRDNSTRICGPGRHKCISEAREGMIMREADAGISGEKKSGDCNCLPACTSLTYNTEINDAPYNWLKFFQATDVGISRYEGSQLSILTLYFKEQQFDTSERVELHSSTDSMD